MVLWIKQENGQTIRLEDDWTHSIYAATNDRTDFSMILQNKDIMPLVRTKEIVSRRERITDNFKSDVLKLTLNDSASGPNLARRIEALGPFGKFRLYNVDLLPAQFYFYDHDLFPLAFCEVTRSNGKNDFSIGSPCLRWNVLDDIQSTDYVLPSFKVVRLGAHIKKQTKIPKFSDPIASVVFENAVEGRYEIEGNSELDILQSLEREVETFDSDFICTIEGDSFLFPYLIHRAKENGIALSLSREKTPLEKPSRPGTSYFSYGRIYFKPVATKLYGRIHIDMFNSFMWDESGMHGLYEVARICRMPLHTAARASIGKCLSSLQFYQAVKNDILIPWKPVLAEHFKTFGELLVADRGGFIFEPRAGVYENVAEFDFASLYPCIMYQKNISAETVRCECCPDSKERVPELGYNICEKREGIVPKALKIVITKRARYKELKKAAKNQKIKSVYDARQNALKWINVATFGYLGFNNAKFGRIDAHIAVCAFDRKIFLQAVRIAENQGFKVLHGIVDSLWIQKSKVTKDDYIRLKERIETETGFAISFEGVYKWIAFLRSKENVDLPVANRYFGAFENGNLKIRGIEARRHDTPVLFRRFQEEILRIMAAGNAVQEVKNLMPEVKDVFDKYVAQLKSGKVPAADLLFAKRLSKDSDQYEDRNVAELHSLNQLAAEGKKLKAGETVEYLITNYAGRRMRTVPRELVDENTTYDIPRYVELLTETYNSIIEPFELGSQC